MPLSGMKNYSNAYWKVPFRLHGSDEVQYAMFKVQADAIHFVMTAEGLHAGFLESVEARSTETKTRYDKDCERTQKFLKKHLQQLKKQKKQTVADAQTDEAKT